MEEIQDLVEIEDHRVQLEQELAELVKKISQTEDLIRSHQRSVQQAQDAAKRVNTEAEARTAEQKLVDAQRLLEKATRDLQDYQYDKELQTENVAALQAEEEELGKVFGISMIPNADTFRESGLKIYQKIRTISNMNFFVSTKELGSVPSFLEWDSKQKERRDQQRSQLGSYIRTIATLANETVFYKNNATGWKSWINRIEHKVIEAVVRAVHSSLFEVANSMHAYTPPLFTLVMRLNQNSKLSFTPLVTDVQTIVTNLCKSILESLIGLGRVHSNLSLKPELLPEISADYFTLVSGSPEVKSELVDINHCCEVLPDRIVELVCQIEDEYKCVWNITEHDHISSWKEAGKFIIYTNKLKYQWDAHVKLDGVQIDTTAVYDVINKTVKESYEKFKDKNPRNFDLEDPMDSDGDDDNEDISAYYRDHVPSSNINAPTSSNRINNHTQHAPEQHATPTSGQYPAGSAAALRRQQQPNSTSLRNSIDRGQYGGVGEPARSVSPLANGPRMPAAPPAPTDVGRTSSELPLNGHVAGTPVAALRSSGSGFGGIRPISPKQTTPTSGGPPAPSFDTVVSYNHNTHNIQPTSSSSTANHSSTNNITNSKYTQPTSLRGGATERPITPDAVGERRENNVIASSPTAVPSASHEERREASTAEAASSSNARLARTNTAPEPNIATTPKGMGGTIGSTPSTISLGSPTSITGGDSPTAAGPVDQSLYSIYKYQCSKNKIKPNSGLLKMLPKQEGQFISEINMDYNYIGVKGLGPLLEILKLNRRLKMLNLKDNNLENNEIKALVSVLIASDDTLTTLDLSNNPISLAGGSAIIELIMKKKSVTEVRLDGTLIQQKILAKIQEIVNNNKANKQ